jgi:hypothetical protein
MLGTAGLRQLQYDIDFVTQGSRYWYVPMTRCSVIFTRMGLCIRTVLYVQVGLVNRTRGSRYLYL